MCDPKQSTWRCLCLYFISVFFTFGGVGDLLCLTLSSWTMGSLAQFYALFFAITLSLAFICHEAVGQGAPGKSGSRIIFSHELLLSLRTSTGGRVPAGIPAELYTPYSPDDVPVHRTTRRKRGRRGGIRRRLKCLSLDNRRRLPPLPTVLLSNAQSIRNKVDELEAWAKFKPEVREACLLAFTETWLSEADQDGDLAISGFGSPFRLDRSPEITGKSRGGGVCLFVNRRYCNTVVIREKLCTPDIELLSVSLRPHYLPCEFQQLFFTLVYIHPRANAAAAAQLIVDVTHRLNSICPDAPKFILGDFNHCTLTKSLKTYEQYVSCATTIRNSTIDLCYGSVSSAYKSLPMPSLGLLSLHAQDV